MIFNILSHNIRTTEGSDSLGNGCVGMENKFVKFGEIVGVSVGVYIVFKYMIPIVTPFILAYAICQLLYPLAEKINRHTKIPIGIAGIILVLLLAVFVVIVLVYSLNYLMHQIDTMFQNREAILIWIEELFEKVCSFISGFIGSEPSIVEDYLADLMVQLQDGLGEKVFNFLISHGLPFLKTLGTFIIIIIMAFVAAIILIKNKQKMKLGLRRNLFAKEIIQIARRTGQVTASFFKAQGIIMILTAIVCTGGLMLIKNPYAVIVAILIALLDALPLIGSGTILIPWAIFYLFNGDFYKAAVIIILYALCALLREVLEARLMGSKLGINEFYILMATFVGLTLFGLWGIILGPLGLILIIEILNQIDDLKVDQSEKAS